MTNIDENGNVIASLDIEKGRLSEHDALLIANYKLRYLGNQLSSMVCTLTLIKRAMKDKDDIVFYADALEPVIKWIEELASNECKPCETE